MSILIKGMEMPKYCIECKFCGSGSINEFEYWCGLTGSRLGAIGDIVLWEDMCAEDCPLAEVPTPHGRLIDADELYEIISLNFKDLNSTEDFMGIGYDHCIADTLVVIRQASTIIEAEEGRG